ncbi:MAG: hypothetical protein M3Y32_03810 [Pseudomonadota bacterium]|nr:hypothetical protein [Pseudomonadota bacterium]
MAFVLACLLAACADRPPISPPEALFHDALFEAPSQPIDPQQVFALNDDMQRYVGTQLRMPSALRDPRRMLMADLYGQGRLRLHYDASITRNAAEAFEARAGNCLSLAIMTAAFARQLDFPVTFQSVTVEPVYAHQGGLLLASGHVNLVLGRLPAGMRSSKEYDDALVVDFLPGFDLRRQHTEALDERTVVAMYFNNRAAEALAAGHTSDSYWFARAAMEQDPSFAVAANTLAVIYTRRNAPQAAEAALRYALAIRPESVEALSNLAALLHQAGRLAEAEIYATRLAALQTRTPFQDFELGRKALAAGDATRARELFRRELRSQPYQDEVNFWAAQADWALGDAEAAARHLQTAADYSNDGRTRGRYIAKLERLRSLQTH